MNLYDKFDFDLNADTYDDYYKDPLGELVDSIEKRVVKPLLDEISNKKALEIGCGTGHWTKFFSDEGFEITGIDLSGKMLRVAIKKNIENAKFLRGDAQSIDFPNESFPNVFVMTTLEFVNDTVKAIDEIYRVLKPGGYLLVAGLNETSKLGDDKDESTIYQNAEFFNKYSMMELLERFGTHPKMTACVIFDDNYHILDADAQREFTEKERLNKGSFLVGLVRKNK